MINNRIRTIVSTAAGSTLVASALGLAALGFSGAATAASAHAPQTNLCRPNPSSLRRGDRRMWICPGQHPMGWQSPGRG